jgi:hypothetical protein
MYHVYVGLLKRLSATRQSSVTHGGEKISTPILACHLNELQSNSFFVFASKLFGNTNELTTSAGMPKRSSVGGKHMISESGKAGYRKYITCHPPSGLLIPESRFSCIIRLIIFLVKE